MGKVNVYLPDDLEQEVRDAGFAISPVCQAALRAVLDRTRELRELQPEALGPPGVVGRLTKRLITVLADVEERRGATALELLGAILANRDNLGARVLNDLGVELPPRRHPAARRADAAQPAPAVRDVLVAALHVSIEMHHNYIGTEHVVIALSSEDTRARDAFTALGIETRAVKQRVERLIASPWAANEPEPKLPNGADKNLLARLEAELRRLTEEFERLRGDLGTSE